MQRGREAEGQESREARRQGDRADLPFPFHFCYLDFFLILNNNQCGVTRLCSGKNVIVKNKLNIDYFYRLRKSGRDRDEEKERASERERWKVEEIV